jgi:hypothetical protein
VEHIYIAVIKLIKMTSEIMSISISVSVRPAVHVTTDMYPTCQLKSRAFPGLLKCENSDQPRIETTTSGVSTLD